MFVPRLKLVFGSCAVAATVTLAACGGSTSAPSTIPTTGPLLSPTSPAASPVASPTASAPATTSPSGTPATASPTPTTTPTTAAAGAIVVSPTTIIPLSNPTVGCMNGPYTFTATEPGVTAFTAVSSDTTYATVAASTTPGTFVVTPTSTNKQLGATSVITVSDAAGNTATVTLKFSGVCLL